MLSSVRLKIIYSLCLLIFVGIALRVFYLQVLRGTFFQNLAEEQSTRVVKLKAHRGRIFDSKRMLLAEDTYAYSVWADPLLIKNKESAARTISLLIGESSQAILKKLSVKKRFVWLKRKVDYDVYQRVQEKKLSGIFLTQENVRLYPQGPLAAQVLGFVDVDQHGLEGVELKYDQYLRGRDGWVYSLRDCKGQLLPLKNLLVPARDGYDVILNIDAQVQHWSEHFLEAAIKKYRAKGGSVVVMSPQTGRIIAMVNYPYFNPNTVAAAVPESVRNRSITDTFEPGSVFKAVTLVAALNENRFKETDRVFCENGEYKIPGSILHDFKPYGTLTFAEVFEKSSNIGVAKIANALSPAILYNYIKKFRFGEALGIDLPGEVRGLVKKPETWSKTSRFIIPIGQEVTATALQIAGAFGMIANGGYMVKPQVVDKVVSKEGVTIKKYPVYRSREPVVPTAVIERAKAVLTRVVSDGTAQAAHIDGVSIAGKTGTAQKVEPGTHHYSKSRYIVSFVGFFPAEAPEYVVVVAVDEPAYAQYGGVICAPVFKQIAEFLLKYRNTVNRESEHPWQ